MNSSLKPTILSTWVLSFAGLGDAFLYTALPVNFLQMNVPVVWIGFLLSINRFVRLIANQMFVYVFNEFGFRKITLLAAIIAMITTFSYGISAGILLWITARIVWGFCFSALRMSSVMYALQHQQQGFSLGLNKGLYEIGPVMVLLAGPLLVQWTNPSTTFFIIGICSVVAGFLALYLPELDHKSANPGFRFDIVPSPFNILTFLNAFFVQGVLIVTITALFYNPDISLTNITVIAGIYLAYRRICSIIISPFGGKLADKFGLNKMYLVALFFTIAGLFFISTGLTQTGILVVFTFNSITSALAPGNVIEAAHHPLKAIATNNTWNDIGSAAGTFTGGLFLQSIYLKNIYFLSIFVLSIAGLYYIKTIKFQTRELFIWK